MATFIYNDTTSILGLTTKRLINYREFIERIRNNKTAKIVVQETGDETSNEISYEKGVYKHSSFYKSTIFKC